MSSIDRSTFSIRNGKSCGAGHNYPCKACADWAWDFTPRTSLSVHCVMCAVKNTWFFSGLNNYDIEQNKKTTMFDIVL